MSTGEVQSNSSGHYKSVVDQQSSSTVGRKSSTPRYSVRFAESSPAPLDMTAAGLDVTARLDVYDADVSSTPPDSANNVRAVETQQHQPATGARLVTSPPGNEPRPVPV